MKKNRTYKMSEERLFWTVEVLMLVLPLVGLMGLYAQSSAAHLSLHETLSGNPALAVAFLTAMIQPFIGWLFYLAKKHLDEADGGYAFATMVGCLCLQLALANMIGVAGIGFMLWRTWDRTAADFQNWFAKRGIKGVLFDLSGVIVCALPVALCVIAKMRI